MAWAKGPPPLTLTYKICNQIESQLKTELTVNSSYDVNNNWARC